VTPLRQAQAARDRSQDVDDTLSLAGNPLGSLGNPFVHSLPVTLGNHTVRDVQKYNWPCPVGPSADRYDEPRIGFGRFRRVLWGSRQVWSSHSYGVVWVQ
jgi:hypothetical protein